MSTREPVTFTVRIEITKRNEEISSPESRFVGSLCEKWNNILVYNDDISDMMIWAKIFYGPKENARRTYQPDALSYLWQRCFVEHGT